MRRVREAGFTLIEMMISITIGLLLLLAVATLFLQSKHSFSQNDQLAALQDQARFALSTLGRDIAMSGYWGGVYLGSQIAVSTTATSGLPAASDCGPSGSSWAFNTANRVEFVNDVAAATTASFNCLQNLRPGTDVVAIRRASGQATAIIPAGTSTATLRPFNFYLKTNGVVGTIFQLGSGASYSIAGADLPNSAPVNFYKFVPRIYYVRSYGNAPGDNIPTLCRRELQQVAAASLAEECLAQGVEDLQIVWGISGPGGTVQYLSAPTQAQLNLAVTAQIFVLMRSTQGDPAYQDTKTYSYADKTGASAYVPRNVQDPAGTPANQITASYYRSLFSTVVDLRNPLPPQ
ncbi:MAG: PilW family protein [Stenotrophobium sp.]